MLLLHCGGRVLPLSAYRIAGGDALRFGVGLSSLKVRASSDCPSSCRGYIGRNQYQRSWTDGSSDRGLILARTYLKGWDYSNSSFNIAIEEIRDKDSHEENRQARGVFQERGLTPPTNAKKTRTSLSSRASLFKSQVMAGGGSCCALRFESTVL